ncbi:hypothetical protein QBZ16_005335 [Prototheca wickerhamii]|uniref:Uncharacterized protein n=1 Tax=Prototheca wickerhamii TaxID=3111 RepID=A0AAD9MJI1_PROWI|nr:hypothetical protein QBZ16_005335 [Prototheca wickerhamii]
MAPGKELDAGPILEADSDENTGIFFKYIGAFKAPPGAEALELPEGAQALPGGPECSVSLSPSSALLSVADGSAVTVYATKSIAASPDAPEALRAVAFDEPVAQFEVQPGNEQRYAARLEDGSLLLGELGAAPVRATEDLTPASCIAWAPSGETLAVASGDRVFLTDPEGAVQRSFRVKSLELQSDDDALAVDGLAWARPDALLVSSRVLAGGEPEPVAATCVVSWQGAQAEQLSLHELFALNIVPGRGQDALRCAAIPEWGALVYAHASAADDHVKVLLAGEGADGRGVAAADVVDDRLAIRVPNAPEDEDNYVTGLGVDRVAGRGRPVPNPVDPDAPDLPPQALLWLATSDGCLRAYTLGSVADRADIVKSEPRPLPDAPVVAGSSGAAGAALSGGDKPDAAAALSAAAAVPLADSDSDFGDEDSAGSNDDGDSSDAKSSGALDQPSAFSLPKPGQTELKPPAATAAPSAAPFGSAGFPAAVPEPPARLGGSEGIAAGIEADFLKSLLASRKLEAETHAAVTSALEKADAVSVSAGEIEECRRGVAAAQTALREQQRSAARLAQSVKDVLRKTAAMPGLLPEGQWSKDRAATPIPDPMLALASTQLRQQLTAARVKLEELLTAVTVLEDRQRCVRLGLEAAEPLRPEQLLDLMKAQAEVTSQRLSQLEDLKREARSLGLLQVDDDEGDEDGYADDLQDDNSGELFGGIANGKATPVGRGAQGLPSLRSVALPSPPRLSLPDATPKQGFAFLGGGTAPPQEARFSGLAAQQTLSPMPAAKPVATKPVGAPAGTGPLFGSPAPSSGLFGAMPQSSAAPPASLSKKETKPALTAPTAAKTAAAPAAAAKAASPASAAAAPKPKPLPARAP